MKKLVTPNDIKDKFFDGMKIMIGGFMACGTPEGLIDLILDLGIKDITLIANDTATPDRATGRLIIAKRVKKLYASHIGLNPETGRQLHAGDIEVKLIPQGTLAEQIRAGGFGLGGVLTPTGVGTIVAEGKKVIEIDGKNYLLEKPIKADLALIRGSIVDFYGNVFYRGTTNNFNQIMASAAKVVIVEAEKVVPVGSINKESIHTPSIYVDYIIKSHTESFDKYGYKY